MDHVHALGPHDGAHAAQIPECVERVAPDFQGEAGQRLEPGLARLLLEAVARDEPEQDPVPARAKPAEQADHRLGAPRPPAIGHQVEHGERPDRAHASSSS